MRSRRVFPTFMGIQMICACLCLSAVAVGEGENVPCLWRNTPLLLCIGMALCLMGAIVCLCLVFRLHRRLGKELPRCIDPTTGKSSQTIREDEE